MKSSLLLVLSFATVASAVDLSTLARTRLVLPETVIAHASELGFTSDQESKLKAYADEMRPKIAALEATVREEQSKLEQAIQAPTATVEATSSTLDQLLAAESAVKHAQLKVLIELRDMLTPEQRAKAIALAGKDGASKGPLEQRVTAKADRLRQAYEQLGVTPPESLKEKGAVIEQLMRDGDLAGADAKLDALAKEVGLDEAAADVPVDFKKFDPGSTDLDTLKQRYADATAKAKLVTKLPTLRLLAKGRDELEKAKAAEDAEGVARILTWAEGILSAQP